MVQVDMAMAGAASCIFSVNFSLEVKNAKSE